MQSTLTRKGRLGRTAEYVPTATQMQVLHLLAGVQGHAWAGLDLWAIQDQPLDVVGLLSAAQFGADGETALPEIPTEHPMHDRTLKVGAVGDPVSYEVEADGTLELTLWVPGSVTVLRRIMGWTAEGTMTPAHACALVDHGIPVLTLSLALGEVWDEDQRCQPIWLRPWDVAVEPEESVHPEATLLPEHLDLIRKVTSALLPVYGSIGQEAHDSLSAWQNLANENLKRQQ